MKRFFLLLISILTIAFANAQFASRLFKEQNNAIVLTQRAQLAPTTESTSATVDLPPFQDLNGMLNFSGDFKGLSIVPTISLWGKQVLSDYRGSILFEGFIGLNKNDSLLYNSALKLFLPESSQYGFSFKGQHLIPGKDKSIPAKSRMYFTWQGNLLGKTYVYADPATKDSSDESSFVFHPKAGLDFVVANGLLNFYGSINGLMRLTNVEKFDATFKNEKDMNWFFDIGLGIMVNLEKGNTDPKNTAYLQLGSILKGLDANTFLQTKDVLVPTFKVTLISRIGERDRRELKVAASKNNRGVELRKK